ncbi:MAG: hypothetical protein HY602_02350 [Parcubacteria group bacterium]|nr:hypothetical protein [Parcubacteria group bacterium]
MLKASIKFTLFLFWFISALPAYAAVGSLSLSPAADGLKPSELIADHQIYPFLKIDIKSSAGEEIRIQTVRFHFIDASGAPLPRGEIRNLKLYSQDGAILEGSGYALSANGDVVFTPAYKMLKDSVLPVYAGGEIPLDGTAREFQVYVDTDDIVGVGITSGKVISPSGSRVTGPKFTIKRDLSDLYVKSLSWRPSVVRAFKIDPLRPEPTDAVEFTVVIGNQGGRPADLKGSSYSLNLTVAGNSIFSFDFAEEWIIPANGEREVQFAVGPKSELRRQKGLKKLILAVDQGDKIKEADETNNVFETELLVLGNERLELKLSPQSLAAAALFFPPVLDVKLAEYEARAFNGDPAAINGADIQLLGCGNAKALQNIRLANAKTGEIYGGFDAFPVSLIEKIVFKTPLSILPQEGVNLSIRADLAEPCLEEFALGIAGLDTQAEVSSIIFPVGSNKLRTGILAAPPKKEEPAPVIIEIKKPIFAYGKPRGSLLIEREKAVELKLKLLQLFKKKTLPIHSRHWGYYVNAYVYGGYPVEAIKQSLILGGKTVHPAIPWVKWKESRDYKNNIGKL